MKKQMMQYTPGMFTKWKYDDILDGWDNFPTIMWGLGYELDYFKSFEEYKKQSKLKVKEPHSKREERRNALFLLEHAPRQIVGNYLFSEWRSYTRMDMYVCDGYGLDFLRRIIELLESKYESEWIKHESLTVFIPLLEEGASGQWAEQHGDGSKENPYTFPFVIYSPCVRNLEEAIYRYVDNHQKEKLNDYGQILKKNGLKWDFDIMKNADAENLDATAVMALLVGAFRAEKFWDGVLLEFCRTGCILKWLRRLKEIDEAG